jgi:NAD(P)-dependent dehydrogenase (short-subunit alcohol dehydrogenase family)
MVRSAAGAPRTTSRTEGAHVPKTIVITGSSDGIGAAAARQLHEQGHHVVVVGRSPQKTRAVAEAIGADHHVADFGRLADVRRLAADLLDRYPRIDVLANNAGGVISDRARTADGFDPTFQINHLAPFLLTRLLMDRLIASRASVLQTSSIGARMSGRLDPDDLGLERAMTTSRAYGTAKLQNILFTKELHARHGQDGIAAAAFHPGNVASSFGKDARGLIHLIAVNPVARRFFFVSPEQGADQLVWLATSEPGTDWQPGLYLEKRRPAKTSPQADDAELARRLWEHSENALARTSA